MKNISLISLIVTFLIFSCTDEDSYDEFEIPGGDTSLKGKKIVRTSGQFIFSEYGGGGGNPYGIGGGGSGCDLHSLIFEQDSTFSIYLNNYVLMGTYSVDTSNNSNTISFYVGNDQIGVISNAETDSISNELTGTVNFPGLIEETSGVGSPDSAYNENLTYVPDDIFEQYLIDQGWDDVLDDYFVTENVKNVESMDLEAIDPCQEINCNYDEFYDFDNRFSDRITDLSGIEAFISLKYLNIRGNKIDSINLTQNTQLYRIFANFNEFKGVNTDFNLELNNIAIDDNIPNWGEGCYEIIDSEDTITKLSFVNNSKIEHISVPSVGLNKLDISNNPNLKGLIAGNNNFTSIDFSNNNGGMVVIKLGNNNLTELNVTNFPLLEVFSVPENNLKSLDLSNNSLLREISVSNNTNLEGILDVSFMPNLAGTDVCHNCLGELYVHGTKLECIQLSEDQLAKYEAGELERWSLGNIPYSLNCN